MADRRAYFKLDIGYLTNPKIVSISEESPFAVLLHMGAIAYSAQHLTDGVVPLAVVRRMVGATKEDVEILERHGVLIPLPDGKHEVKDFLEHQRSSSEAKRATEKASKAAEARWNKPPSMPPSMPGASDVGMPREKEREREVKGPRKRGTRLPDDWTPSDDLKRWTSEECPGLNGPATAAKFRDYWHGVAGAKGLKLDWDATWRNWCRNEYERSAR